MCLLLALYDDGFCLAVAFEEDDRQRLVGYDYLVIVVYRWVKLGEQLVSTPFILRYRPYAHLTQPLPATRLGGETLGR